MSSVYETLSFFPQCRVHSTTFDDCFCLFFLLFFVLCLNWAWVGYGSGVGKEHSSGFPNLLRPIFAETGCALCRHVTCITCICPCICWVKPCCLHCYLYLHVFVLVFAELKLAQSLQCSEQLFWHDTPPKFVLWCQIKSDSAARTYVCAFVRVSTIDNAF